MRIELTLLFTVIALTGCQSAARKDTPPPPTPIVAASSLDLQEKVRRQEQHIQALIAQNDALLARVRAFETTPASAPIETPPVVEPHAVSSTPLPLPTPLQAPDAPATLARVEPVSPVVLVVPPPTPADEPPRIEPTAEAAIQPESVLTPNADGVIDLAAVLTQPKDADVNPFAVRSLPADTVRELTIHIGGIIGGSTPCALVNDRPMQSGETLESLTLVRAETDAVFFRCGTHLLRLPMTEKPTRVRLVL